MKSAIQFGTLRILRGHQLEFQNFIVLPSFLSLKTGLEVIILEYSLRLKIKGNDWLLADRCWFVSPSSQSLRFILSLRMNSNFITSRPG